MTEFMNRRALVTGANSGLGQAMARALAEAGATVALHYRRNQEAVDTLAATLRNAGHTVHVIQGDLSTTAGTRQVADAAVAALTRFVDRPTLDAEAVARLTARARSGVRWLLDEVLHVGSSGGS